MRYFLALLTSVTLFATESQLELRFDINPFYPNSGASFNISTTTCTTLFNDQHAALITPEVNFYQEGRFDFSLTKALRHRFDKVVIGENIFLDRSHLHGIFLDQVGTGLDILTRSFDFRCNYYHPISSPKNIEMCRWVDGELFYKTKWFGVGTGPLYNIECKAWALHSRLVIPLKYITINIGGLCGGGTSATSRAVLSLSFHIFKPSKKNRLFTPPSHIHKSNFYYSSVYVFEEDPHPETPRVKYKFSLCDEKIHAYIDSVEEDIATQNKRDIDERDESGNR